MVEEDRSDSFFAELRRRHVVRVSIAYGAAAFVILQLADLVFPALGVPEWGYRFLVVASLVGFPVALILAWLYDLTPEGVVRTGSRGEAGAVVARLRHIVVYGAGGLATVAVLVVAFLWAQPRSAMGDVAPGADVIAVLPFTTSGQDVEVLGEGMVDLLSRNLDQVGVIRTVDSRAVLYRWEQRAQDSRLPPEAAYALGRDVGAGSILWGNVLEVGGMVRMNAELVDIDGIQLAAAEVEGPADQVLALVDSLSLAVVRSIWRARRPIPSIDLSAITTGDLASIRQFLAGERFYRASQWDSAVAAFQRAIEADSTFALAHFRLANTLGWASSTPEREELERRAAAKALELADRLPSRARTLVIASDLWVNGDREEAVDTLAALVGRYPDDFEGVYFHTDASYHLKYERLGPRRPAAQAALRSFERTLELDPSFAPALIHPFEVSFLVADTTLIDRYLDALRRTSGIDSLAILVYSRAARAIRNPTDIDALALALETAFAGEETGLGALAWQAARAVTLPLMRQAATLSARERERLLERLRAGALASARARSSSRLLSEIRLMQVSGRLSEAQAKLEEALARGDLGDGNVRYFTRMSVYAGYADSSLLGLGGAYQPTNSNWPLAEMLEALDRRDTQAVRRIVDRLSDPGIEDNDRADLVRRAGDLFIRVDSGADVAALDELENLLAEIGFNPGAFTEPLWFRWLERLAEFAERRAEAIEILRRPWVGDPVFEAPRIFALARALETDGDMDGARRSYQDFRAILADADPGMPIESKIDAAGSALKNSIR